MTAILNVLVGMSASTLPPSLAAGSSTGESPVGNNATGLVRFNSDGTISYLGTAVENGGPPPTQWATVVAAGIGNGIFIRATPTAGTLTLNPAVAFTALSSNLSFTKGPSIANTSTTVTFEFSYDGAAVALTSAGWLIQAAHA